jgi:hypothetical protein
MELSAATPTPPTHTLSMTDEESDIEDFRAYVATLPPDALWDVFAHLDRDQYPRRHEMVEREIARRDLFFVSPNTAHELRLRGIVSVCLALAALSAFLRAVGAVVIRLEPWERLSWFFDLAVGAPTAARLVLPLARTPALGGALLAVGCTLLAAWGCSRRRVRPDLLVTVAAAAVLSLLFVRLAFASGL